MEVTYSLFSLQNTVISSLTHSFFLTLLKLVHCLIIMSLQWNPDVSQSTDFFNFLLFEAVFGSTDNFRFPKRFEKSGIHRYN